MMKIKTTIRLTVLLCIFLLNFGFTQGLNEMKSVGVLHFGPDNELFVADSKTGTIFAFDVPAGETQMEPRAYNLYDIDVQIAAMLGANVEDIAINDMVVHPTSGVAYLSTVIFSMAKPAKKVER